MGHKFKPVLGTVCAFLCALCLSHQASGQALPDGKGKAEFVHNCTACHRADMVTAVRKTPEAWRKSVDEMAARGTDGSKEDLDNVVLYLVTNYSSEKSAPAQAAPSPVPDSARLTLSEMEGVQRFLVQSECLTCARLEQQGVFIVPPLSGVGTRRKADEIRAATVSQHPTPGRGKTHPTRDSDAKGRGEDLNSLVRYLLSEARHR